MVLSNNRYVLPERLATQVRKSINEGIIGEFNAALAAMTEYCVTEKCDPSVCGAKRYAVMDSLGNVSRVTDTSGFAHQYDQTMRRLCPRYPDIR